MLEHCEAEALYCVGREPSCMLLFQRYLGGDELRTPPGREPEVDALESCFKLNCGGDVAAVHTRWDERLYAMCSSGCFDDFVSTQEMTCDRGCDDGPIASLSAYTPVVVPLTPRLTEKIGPPSAAGPSLI